MKSRDTLIRLIKFQVDERRRKVAQIEVMIAEFERMAGDLEREIKTEQERAGIHDPAHFAYPTYAKAAMSRRGLLCPCIPPVSTPPAPPPGSTDALRCDDNRRLVRARMLSAQELVWLMAAVAKGDRAAFERLYAATRAKLYGVVLRILRRQ